MSTKTLNGEAKLLVAAGRLIPNGKIAKPLRKSAHWQVPKVAIIENLAESQEDTFNAFLEGRIPAVRVKNFASKEMCSLYTQAAFEYGFERYKDAPEVGKIGLPLVDNPELPAYLEQAQLLRHQSLHFGLSISLLNQVMGFVSNATGRKCEVLEKYGVKFWAGNWRLLSGGAGIHKDVLGEDCPEMVDIEVEFQGSFVFHISTPENGGETMLYDKFLTEEDKEDALYKESGWKYSPQVVEGVRSIQVPAKTGELVFLPTLKAHSVNPSQGSSQERISFSAFFIIKKNDDTIFFYS
jgi:hypothetical protein